MVQATATRTGIGSTPTFSTGLPINGRGLQPMQAPPPAAQRANPLRPVQITNTVIVIPVPVMGKVHVLNDQWYARKTTNQFVDAMAIPTAMNVERMLGA